MTALNTGADASRDLGVGARGCDGSRERRTIPPTRPRALPGGERVATGSTFHSQEVEMTTVFGQPVADPERDEKQAEPPRKRVVAAGKLGPWAQTEAGR